MVCDGLLTPHQASQKHTAILRPQMVRMCERSLGALEDGATSIPCTVSGVSVSPIGFHIVLMMKQEDTYVYLPLPVTRSEKDATTASTPQALTLLQLLAGVDMAGAVLPPELLSQLVVVVSELCSNRNKEDADPLADFVTASVQKTVSTTAGATNTMLEGRALYMDQNPWIKSKIRLPTTTLEDVIVISSEHFVLNCVMEGYGRHSILLNDHETAVKNIWKELLYDSDNASAAFTALALALRYKAPICMRQSSCSSDDTSLVTMMVETSNTLLEKFPKYKSASQVLEPADRSAEQITRGFEIHTLQAALRLAMMKHDAAAATKIRAELDRLDAESMNQLPVQPESDINSMQ
jgi:hypothetical protein